MDVLILGGTALARELAERLVSGGSSVVTSLAGRTRSPGEVPGGVRVGGFDGVAGLVEWLKRERPACVVDATHAFAATMSEHAAQACREAGVPLGRLQETSWRSRPDAGRWDWCDTHEAAAALAANLHGAVLLTVGRQPVRCYLTLGPRDVTVRVVDPPEVLLPDGWELLRDRGPFALAAERELFARRGIGVLVTKDAGGTATSAKLDVAAERNARVVMVQRPEKPLVDAELDTVEAAAHWVRQR